MGVKQGCRREEGGKGKGGGGGEEDEGKRGVGEKRGEK